MRPADHLLAITVRSQDGQFLAETQLLIDAATRHLDELCWDVADWIGL